MNCLTGNLKKNSKWNKSISNEKVIYAISLKNDNHQNYIILPLNSDNNILNSILIIIIIQKIQILWRDY